MNLKFQNNFCHNHFSNKNNFERQNLKDSSFNKQKMQKQINQYNQISSNKMNQDQQNNDYEDEQDNLTPQPKTYQNQYEEKPETELENIIMEKIKTKQKQEDTISKQLEIKLDKLLEKITFSSQANDQQKLKLRMHQLALSKILVHTHGKSEFYLVKAHHHLGEAYLRYKCYQQALDHLTLSLKKNAKINDMNEIKLYHSYVLTTYSRCYYEISSFQDALQILKKANDIQLGCENQDNKIDNIETLKLISNCYLKSKKYPDALQFIGKALKLIQIKKGKQSKQYAKTKIEMAKILVCDSNKNKQAIKELSSAIQTLEVIKYQNQLQIADYYELLSTYYEKENDHEKQIQQLYKKLQIYVDKYEQGHQKTLKVKKNIAFLLQKHNKFNQAIKQLQEVLEYEEKYYPQNRSQLGKTLKALGMCCMSIQNKMSLAETYLKKAQKLLSDNGVSKTVKEIKIKLQQIKDKKDNKSGQKDELKNFQKQIQQHPIEMAH